MLLKLISPNHLQILWYSLSYVDRSAMGVAAQIHTAWQRLTLSAIGAIFSSRKVTILVDAHIPCDSIKSCIPFSQDSRMAKALLICH